MPFGNRADRTNEMHSALRSSSYGRRLGVIENRPDRHETPRGLPLGVGGWRHSIQLDLLPLMLIPFIHRNSDKFRSNSYQARERVNNARSIDPHPFQLYQARIDCLAAVNRVKTKGLARELKLCSIDGESKRGRKFGLYILILSLGPNHNRDLVPMAMERKYGHNSHKNTHSCLRWLSSLSERILSARKVVEVRQ